MGLAGMTATLDGSQQLKPAWAMCSGMSGSVHGHPEPEPGGWSTGARFQPPTCSALPCLPGSRIIGLSVY